MAVLNSFVRLAGNVASILRFAPLEHRSPLLLTYLRIELKYLFLVKFLRLNIRTENIFGFCVEFFDYSNFVLLFDEIFVTDVYFFRHEANAPFIIDCGSNIGMAVIYFKWLYPESKIIAFEPDQQICQLLNKNVTRNGFQDVTVVNKALYSWAGSSSFYYNPRHGGSTVNSLLKESVPDPGETQVETTLLSNYVSNQVDYLKIDIEGVEDAVLEELSHMNRLGLVRQMAVEYHHHLQRGCDKLSKFLSLLERHGFAYQIQASLRTPFQKDQFQAMFIYAYQK